MFRAILLVVFSLPLFVPSFSSAETIIDSSESYITEDQIWTTLGSPYLIMEPLIVESGAKLKIENGVVVKFEYGTSINIFGSIEVGSVDGEPVYFTSVFDESVPNNPDNPDFDYGIPGDWSGINFYNSLENSYFINTIIKHSDKGISILNSNLIDFGKVLFHKNNEGIFVMNSPVKMEDISFEYTNHSISLLNSKSNLNKIDIRSTLDSLSNNSVEIYGNSEIFVQNLNIEDVIGAGIVVYDKSIVDGKNIKIKNSKGDALMLYNESIGFFDNLHTENTSSLMVFNDSQFNLKNSTIKNNTGQYGLYFFTNSKVDLDNVNVLNGGTSSALIAYQNTELNIKNSVFDGGLGEGVFVFDGVSGNIKNIKIKNFEGSGIWARYPSVNVSVEGSLIENNQHGLFVIDDANISVEQSKIANNNIGIETFFATKLVSAKNNYWGKQSGPYNATSNPLGEGDRVSDFVDFNPWLTSDPLSGEKGCCSSVIFLPGIKGSVLEKVNVTKENDRLWPPAMFSNDVIQLEINENGTSKYPIVVDGIIDTFYKTKVYSEFSEFMDNLSTIDENTGTSTIKEWLPLAYDWRFSPEKIINDGIQTKSDGRIDVIERLEELAQNSNTGKVSIVAHSMGGLLGKEIIKKMEELGKSHLIESFVMVGTPQLGTPQAIGSLLHGDGESIVGGMIASKYDMREVGQNMQSAFNLLPSELYFERVSDPVMRFNNKAGFTEDWRNYWGDSISNYFDFTEFLSGEGVVREEPSSTEVLKPEILRSDLLEHSKNLHAFYDEYKMPSSIRVVQVAGWGIPTLKGIEYKNHHRSPSYEALFTKEGDSTVVYPSAVLPDLGEVYYLNLVDYNKKSSLNTQHGNILSAGPTQKIIRCLVKNNQIENIDYVSNYKPQISDLGEQLLVSTHSPVILGAYDGDGNFTGVEPNQDLSLGFLQIKEEIPGSSFIALGDSQYVFLPKEGTYDFVFSGTGNGEVTVEIKNFVDDAPELITSFTDIPVTETSQASFVVEASEPLKTKIQIDEDGDGEIDSLILPDNTNPSLSDLLQILKDKISSLNIKDKIKKNLLKRINNLEKKIERKKEQNVKILERIEKDINNKTKNGRIEVNSAEEILNIINELDAVSNSIQLDPDLLLSLKTKIESLSIKPALETSLIIRVERLEKKQMLTNTLARLNNMINKNQNSGKMSDTDANEIIKILEQIESLL